MSEQFPKGFGWHQPHHWYWGVIMSTIGFIMLFEVHGWWYMIPILIGIHWMLDDLWQHTRQSRSFYFLALVSTEPGVYGPIIKWYEQDPNYTSPVHNWYWSFMCWLRDHSSGWVNRVVREIMRY